MRKIRFIVVHCSDTPNGRDDRAEDIHRWHRERGWDGIGYNAVITADGYLEPGRPDYWEGAHVAGHNAESLGVCLIGTDRFTDDQLRTLEGWLLAKQADHPEAEVVGHRDLDSRKTCPNFDVSEWWRNRSKKHID